MTETVWPGKLKIFTLWSFTEKGYQPLFYTMVHIRCLPPTSLHVLGPDIVKRMRTLLSPFGSLPLPCPLGKSPPQSLPQLGVPSSGLPQTPVHSFIYYNFSPPSCYELHGGRFLPYSTLTRQETAPGTGHNYSINISQMNEFHCQLCEGTF